MSTAHTSVVYTVLAFALVAGIGAAAGPAAAFDELAIRARGFPNYTAILTDEDESDATKNPVTGRFPGITIPLDGDTLTIGPFDFSFRSDNFETFGDTSELETILSIGVISNSSGVSDVLTFSVMGEPDQVIALTEFDELLGREINGHFFTKNFPIETVFEQREFRSDDVLIGDFDFSFTSDSPFFEPLVDTLEIFPTVFDVVFSSCSPECFVIGPIPTPEPGTLLLVGSGLAGMLAFGRRRSSRKQC